MRGHSKLLVAPQDYRPRLEMSIAHELVEQELERHVPDHERFCERAAAALALPRLEFLATLAWNGYCAPTTRRQWPWASYELILWRAVELLPAGAAAAKWLNGELVERRSSRATLYACERKALRSRRALPVLEDGVLARAWSVPRGRDHWAFSLAVRL